MVNENLFVHKLDILGVKITYAKGEEQTWIK
jgi:hypothetical protein